MWFQSAVSGGADPVPRRQTNSEAAKVYWRRLNLKRSLPVLEWTSESERFKKNCRHKVSRGNSGRGVNFGRCFLFSGEEGLHFQTWYAG